MDSSKLKTIILVLLLCLNAALAAVVAADRQASASADEALARTARAVLEENGLRLSKNADLSGEAQIYTVTRSIRDEEKYVSAVLGEDLSTQDSGGIRYYEGTSGMGRFHGTGEFEVYLTSGTYTAKDDGIRTALAFLKDLGITAYEPLTSSADGSSGVMVTTVCTVKGAPVYNCGITLSFIDESLMAIAGHRPFPDVKLAETAESPLDIYTVLLRFLTAIRSEGDVGRELSQVELGYKLVSSLSGESRLTPVWHFVTDTGEYYIDGITGEPIAGF